VAKRLAGAVLHVRATKASDEGLHHDRTRRKVSKRRLAWVVADSFEGDPWIVICLRREGIFGEDEIGGPGRRMQMLARLVWLGQRVC
jgi:hypothetical protein